MDDETGQKPQHKGLRKGLYVIPTLFTAANVGMGFLAVLWSVRGFHAAMTDPASAAVQPRHLLMQNRCPRSVEHDPFLNILEQLRSPSDVHHLVGLVEKPIDDRVVVEREIVAI